MRHAGRGVVITGAGSGVGRALATAFVREGATVLAVDRDEAGLEETARRLAHVPGGLVPLVADVLDEAGLESIARAAGERLGGAEVLVNNVGGGVFPTGDLHGLDAATWLATFDLNVTHAMRLIELLLPGMIARGRGVVLAISSQHGLVGGGDLAYAASKAGVVALVRRCALLAGPAGIRAAAICPGNVRTERHASWFDAHPEIAGLYPLGRVGDAIDVAEAAVFLASDDARWITGIALPVDGGYTARRGRGSER